MARSDAGAVASVLASAVGDGVRRVEAVHQAIAHRSWRPTMPWTAPSKAVHDMASAVSYATVGAGVAASGAVVAEVLDVVSRAGGRGRLADSPAGVAALAVLDAFAGDHLARQGSPLALAMTIRHDGRALALDGDGPLDVPDATEDVVVFVHGLAGWEGSWWRGTGEDGTAPSYGDRLRERLGVTPVYVRYNTGLPVADNGEKLAEQLDRLAAGWPVPLRRLHLVGHSMGGLVIRSACHAGHEHGHGWTSAVRHCAYLGTPHLGAPLARAAVALGSLLVLVPELRPFASLLARPSGGIRDLRFGLPLAAGIDEAEPADWFGHDLEDVALLPSTRHHAVSAALTRRAGSPVDQLLGDLLVLTPSATGQGGNRRRLGFDSADGAHIPGADHFSLLNHPAVLDQLIAWLDEPDAR
jgi:pimeloyl-ACP methyl ester carboxylesterase